MFTRHKCRIVTPGTMFRPETDSPHMEAFDELADLGVLGRVQAGVFRLLPGAYAQLEEAIHDPKICLQSFEPLEQCG
jgi:hypothetical protein